MSESFIPTLSLKCATNYYSSFRLVSFAFDEFAHELGDFVVGHDSLVVAIVIFVINNIIIITAAATITGCPHILFVITVAMPRFRASSTPMI